MVNTDCRGGYGALYRLARGAASHAVDDAKRKGLVNIHGERFTNPLHASLLIYTDCPATAGALKFDCDLADVCGVSAIDDVLCVVGDAFPSDAFEAPRDDLEMPRIAAMFFHAEGSKCPRCRKVSGKSTVADLCVRCAAVVHEKGG